MYWTYCLHFLQKYFVEATVFNKGCLANNGRHQVAAATINGLRER
jgi:hypothetical protein